jgi:hypothetical protein
VVSVYKAWCRMDVRGGRGEETTLSTVIRSTLDIIEIGRFWPIASLAD